MSDRLERALAAVPELAGRVSAVEELAGGLAHVTLKVETPGRAYVVKLFAAGHAGLAVDHEVEAECTRIAAAAGVGPAVVAYLPEQAALVREYLPGIAQTAESIGHGDGPARAARILGRLHRAPPFPRSFDLFGALRSYLALADAHDLPAPAGHVGRAARLAEVEAALVATAGDPCPCHNDLMPSNFIDVGGGELRLIDFEYAGNGDPCCDLGALWDECAMSLDQLERMVGERFGTVRPTHVARARLWAAVASYTWSAWAVVRAADPTPPPDAWDVPAWAAPHLARAVTVLDSPELAKLVDAL